MRSTLAILFVAVVACSDDATTPARRDAGREDPVALDPTRFDREVLPPPSRVEVVIAASTGVRLGVELFFDKGVDAVRPAGVDRLVEALIDQEGRLFFLGRRTGRSQFDVPFEFRGALTRRYGPSTGKPPFELLVTADRRASWSSLAWLLGAAARHMPDASRVWFGVRTNVGAGLEPPALRGLVHPHAIPRHYLEAIPALEIRFARARLGPFPDPRRLGDDAGPAIDLTRAGDLVELAVDGERLGSGSTVVARLQEIVTSKLEGRADPAVGLRIHPDVPFADVGRVLLVLRAAGARRFWFGAPTGDPTAIPLVEPGTDRERQSPDAPLAFDGVDVFDWADRLGTKDVDSGSPLAERFTAGGADAAEVLLRLATEHRVDAARRAASLLGRVAMVSIDALIDVVRRGAPDERAEALAVLWGMASRKDGPRFEEHLGLLHAARSDPDPDVRREAERLWKTLTQWEAWRTRR